MIVNIILNAVYDFGAFISTFVYESIDRPLTDIDFNDVTCKKFSVKLFSSESTLISAFLEVAFCSIIRNIASLLKKADNKLAFKSSADLHLKSNNYVLILEQFSIFTTLLRTILIV